MAHEISVTRKLGKNKFRNYASSKKAVNKKRPLRTGGRHTFVSESEAVHAAKARSNRSNYGHGSNTTWESSKEEKSSVRPYHQIYGLGQKKNRY